MNECMNNKWMSKLLDRDKLWEIIPGDFYQIESIDYGDWIIVKD